ncbi:CHA1 [Candida oxycetoniae]|uniref:L-serine ammonia-lyase n=1 Tax=Candida oxycetoniae TaxID=497107 RepID=A0AAI9SVA6_9ASCO|nr:CHA1 [Candida oxycetoniae]KAI3403726.2 CHA1 [Candida oxycetoniae]
MSLVNLQPEPRLRSPHVKTSLKEVTHLLPMAPPCRIFFKNENEQPSGSFKLRGIGHLVKRSIEKAQEQGITLDKIHLFASSGGNAGLAAAYSAAFYNVKCTVVIPTIAKPIIIEKLKGYGASVVLQGRSINEADQFLKTLMSNIGDAVFPIYCHPFDNPHIWEGHSSIVDEVVEQIGDNDIDKLKGFVCSFGGGGLYNGIYQGMVNNLVKGDILLIETAQAPTLNESIKANNIITLNEINSLATSLACSYTTKQSLQYYQTKSNGINSKLETIDDMDSLRACVAYKKYNNEVVEPACGAALSVCYNRLDLLFKALPHLQKDDILVIVVCGGSCTTEQDLAHYQVIVKKSETKL